VSEAAQAIALSLVSHTNAGKTTLARTLLCRDVGEVRDEAHVTTSAERFALVESAEGDVLYLWDTPGFGDSARLARRLASLDQPIVGFLAATWDRWRDRAFWFTQLAVRNIRDDADVVLYLVNASESPADAGYLAPELQILQWIGKPVIVLLNQTGPPRDAQADEADVARWREAIAAKLPMTGVLSFDAFARCFVQESVLLREVARVLPADRQAAFARLFDAWRAERDCRFDASMRAIATPIPQAACDRAALPASAWHRSLVEAGRALVTGGERIDPDRQAGMTILAKRLDAAIRTSTNALIRIQHLGGEAADEVMARLASDVTLEAPLDPRKAGVIGGVVSGALTGLAADIASGGLTFGAGIIAGALVGAAGGVGVARAFNFAKGRNESSVRWSDEFIASLVPAAVLRYLAVAHYGRGRGDYAPSEYPAFWRGVVQAACKRHDVASVVEMRRREPCDVTAISDAMTRKLAAICVDVLHTLYPAAEMPALPMANRSEDNGREDA
jgi:uncharacterized protein DUF3482/50S ribosome-binding GTPase